LRSIAAQIISYEEYFPYGGTSFIAGQNQKEVKIKQYRYTGKERDGFTSLYYYGARYYAEWMGRWFKFTAPVQGAALRVPIASGCSESSKWSRTTLKKSEAS